MCTVIKLASNTRTKCIYDEFLVFTCDALNSRCSCGTRTSGQKTSHKRAKSHECHAKSKFNGTLQTEPTMRIDLFHAHSIVCSRCFQILPTRPIAQLCRFVDFIFEWHLRFDVRCKSSEFQSQIAVEKAETPRSEPVLQPIDLLNSIVSRFTGFRHMQHILCPTTCYISFILENLPNGTETNPSTASQANYIGQQ